MQAELELGNEPLDNPEIPEYLPQGEVADPQDGVEDQARALGWKPEDEFTGDKAKWTDAAKFVEVHGRNNGALRKALDRQADELADLRRQMQGMDAAHKKIFALQIKKQKDEFDGQVAFLKAQKREALRQGEHETASDLDEQLDSLRERGPDLPETPTAQTSNVTPGLPTHWRNNKVLSDWADRNAWFDKDEDLSTYAGGIGQQLRAQNPAMPFDTLLEEVTTRVHKAFPHKFAATRRNPVEASTPGGAGSGTGKTYASLPRDAKAACDEAVSEGNGMTQKLWVELYYGYDDRRKR